jgi:thiol-disulfide isomerase/thioredoxin
MRAIRFLLLTSLIVLACSGLATAKTPGEVDVGQTLRDVGMRGLNGRDRRLSEYRGKPLLINVWASWCGPCRAEMGSLERLAWKDESRRFTIIGISTDDSEAAAKGFLTKVNATLNHFVDRQLELENMLGASRLPLTILVDRNGKVLGKYIGAREWDGADAEKWIDATLRSAK